MNGVLCDAPGPKADLVLSPSPLGRLLRHHGCCCPDGFEGEYCQFPEGTLGEDVAVTWSPLGFCSHAETATEGDVFLAPNADGKWKHVLINPKYQMPSHDDVKEDRGGLGAKAAAPTEPTESRTTSSTGGIVAGALASLLLVGGLLGAAHRRRAARSRAPSSFAAEWWRGHAAEWWKGETTIEANTNIAPTSIARSWTYPEETKDSAWEYDRDHGDLHDVAI